MNHMIRRAMAQEKALLPFCFGIERKEPFMENTNIEIKLNNVSMIYQADNNEVTALTGVSLDIQNLSPSLGLPAAERQHCFE